MGVLKAEVGVEQCPGVGILLGASAARRGVVGAEVLPEKMEIQ